MQIPPEVPPLSKKLSPVKMASAALAGLLMLSTGLAAAGATDGSTTEPADVTTTVGTDTPLVAEPGTDVEDGGGGDVVVDGDDSGGEVVVDEKPVDTGDGAGDDADEPKPEDGGEAGTDGTPDGTDGTPDGTEGTPIEDGDGTVVVTVGDPGEGAGDDEVEVEEPGRPEDNHGWTVSQIAGNPDAVGTVKGNHGEAVSAVARTNKPVPSGDDDGSPAHDDHGKGKDKVKGGDDDEDDDADNDADENEVETDRD